MFRFGLVNNVNFVAYTFLVEGSRERYDLICSIIESFHQNEAGTKVIRDDSDEYDLESMSFAVYSELSTDEYDADSVDLQTQAALDILKLEAVLKRRNLEIAPLTVYGATMDNFVWMKLFSIKCTGRPKAEINHLYASFGEDEGEFDLEELGFHDFDFYYTPEGVEEISTILEELRDQDEISESELEYWFENDLCPRSNLTVRECVDRFKEEIQNGDLL